MTVELWHKGEPSDAEQPCLLRAGAVTHMHTCEDGTETQMHVAPTSVSSFCYCTVSYTDVTIGGNWAKDPGTPLCINFMISMNL